jgi:hypothetical protein
VNRRRLHSRDGSILLVALCFVTVLGIALASYIAVCSRTMQISSRTAQITLSSQLAEMGLEEGLRAFNKNDWSDWSNGPSADWTVSGTSATCNLTFPSGTFGQGVSGSVKIRVDNYNAMQANATYSSSASYRVGDLVGYNGIWYRSVRNNNNGQSPNPNNLTWWVTNPMPWTWSSSNSYAQYEMVNYKGIWYRCITPPPINAGTTTYAPQVPIPATAYWTPIPTQRAWSSGVAYAQYDVVAYTNPTTSDVTLYRCLTGHTSSTSFATDAANWSRDVQTVSLAWSSGTIYTRGAIVYYIGASIYRWYYCRQSGPSSTAPSADTTMWAPMWADTTYSAVNPGDTVTAGVTYYPGDYANYSGVWYRCTTTHTYVDPATSAANWTATNAQPYVQLFYFGPNAGSLSITSNNIFYYAGSNWYRYMGGYVLALTGNMHAWVSGNKYNLGDAVYYTAQSKWYRCILAHTSSGTITPTSTTYWATAPAYTLAWDAGRQYSANDTVFYDGVWYLSLNTNTGQNPATATSSWIGANTSTASYQWNISTAYSAGDYKCYGSVWYKCLAGNTGYSPNNTSYWTNSWANSWGVTTGAPVIYAEGTVTLQGSAAIKTQLRAPITAATLFPNAAAANNSTITATSGGTVDSYDSSSGISYASQVNTSTNYSAVIASAYNAGTAITLSSTDVKGYLAAPSSSTSPFAPLYSSGGTVKGFTSPGSPNIDLSRISRSPYIPKFDTVPSGSGGVAAGWSTLHKGTPLALTATTNIGSPGDTNPSRYYYSGNLTIGGASIQYLKINGPVVLYINGDLSITNSSSTGRIDIANGAAAEIHITGAFKADSGGDGIRNYNADPKTLTILCDSSGTSTHFYSSGSNPLYGVIYAPYSTSTSGYYNDNGSAEIYGAISANKVTYSGANMNIHYDTSLRYMTFGGVDRSYGVAEWRELTTAAELATMP